jgi:alpha-beta hydrolase superfamily lysophospholipase
MLVRFTPLLWLAAVAAAQSPEQRSQEVLDLLFSGKLEAFYSELSPSIRSMAPFDKFAVQLQPIVALGKPLQCEPATMRTSGIYTVATIRVHWTRTTLDAVVTWIGTTGELAGVNFRQPEMPKWERPAYSDPGTFTALEVTVGDDEWKLPGTLLMPKGAGPFSAVVLVQGSGGQDRDESVRAIKVFRDLAEGLATKGIAVLRYDSRKFVFRARCEADPEFTLTKESVEDAVRAAAVLRRQPGVEPARIFVLGHSLGGYATPRIIAADPKLAGAIVMGGNSRPFGEVIRDQKEWEIGLKPEPTPADRARLDELRKNPEAALATWGAKYVADLRRYDPAAMARTSTIPMLVLQGERDFEITMRDFEGWKAGLAGRKGATLRSYPRLNHLFIAGEGKGTLAEYERPGHVEAEVVGDIAAWILRLKSPDGTRSAK